MPLSMNMSTKKILVLCCVFGSVPPYRLLSVSLTRLLMSDASSAFFLSGKIEKIGLTGKALYYLVTSYATQTVMLLFVAVGILLAAVLILALLYGFSVKRAVPPPKH